MALSWSRIVESFRNPYKMPFPPSAPVRKEELKPEVRARQQVALAQMILSSFALQPGYAESAPFATSDDAELQSLFEHQLVLSQHIRLQLDSFVRQPAVEEQLKSLSMGFSVIAEFLATSCQNEELLRYFKTKSFLKLMPTKLKLELEQGLSDFQHGQKTVDLDVLDDMRGALSADASLFVSAALPELEYLPAAFSPSLPFIQQLTEAAQQGLARVTKKA